MPIHLRWELYPVPHEAGKHNYGGSYLEEVDWWKKPRHTTLAGELKDMFAEMLFIKRVYVYKRPLWWLTYPFHAGIYLILVWFALLVVHGILNVYVSIPALDSIVKVLIQITGTIGIIAATLGCLGLLFRRLSDADMRKYSAGVEYFNLLFILVVLLTGIAVWANDTNF
jgi:nitrate reductase gamma subunit